MVLALTVKSTLGLIDVEPLKVYIWYNSIKKTQFYPASPKAIGADSTNAVIADPSSSNPTS